MNIQISDGGVVPQIEKLPISGQDILVAFDLARTAIETVKEIGNALIAFAQELGLLPELEITELGDRAIQAIDNGIVPENYSSIEDWVEVIGKDDWGYDSTLSANVSDSSKIVMGMGVIAGYLVDKFQEVPMKDFIISAPTILGIFTGEKLVYLAKLLFGNVPLFCDVVRYLSGTEKNTSVIDRAIDILIDMEQEVDPTISDDEAYDKVVRY